jgi:hypothetical protein
VNLAPSVLLPAESEKKNHPCLNDANPRPYPNEYGCLFFEDESGNNRMVTSERTEEWAATTLLIDETITTLYNKQREIANVGERRLIS